ncbi:glycosyltransferase family 2 protein, partial [Gammaproteobacteria bacterium]|nr:glycosyltransferase family 2 protein [Gammaproteobacteria bacterium]
MKETPSFSVVIPLHNKEQHISRAVESVIRQSYRDFELIVVNDGSTDNSMSIIRKFGNHLKIIEQQNKGVSSARNTGIRQAKNDYIAFLDADDEWHFDFLSHIASMIRDFPQAGIYCTNYYKKLGKQTTLACSTTSNTEPCTIKYFSIAAYDSTPVSSSSVCIPRKVLEHAGLFPENIRLYEDLYLWIKISLEYDLVFDNEPLATYHRDAFDRSCNKIAPDRNSLPFVALIETTAANKTMDDNERIAASVFINKYALLNAFKAATANNVAESRLILSGIIPVGKQQTLRKHLIGIYCLLPSLLRKNI